MSTVYSLLSAVCPRCHSTLHREDEGTLVFCWNCGAPQVQLSEELRDQAEQQLAPPAAADTTTAPLPGRPASTLWRGAIQSAAFAGAIAATLTLLALALPPIGLLSMLWIIAAPVLILRIYTKRFRQTPITAAFGARLGVLTGITILLATTAVNTISLLLQRFVFHSISPLDTQLTATFAQEQTMMEAQLGLAAAAPIVHLFSIPEFRAGILLTGFAIFAALYLLFTTAAGALAGYVRARTT